MTENISSSLKRLDELEGLIETLFLQVEYIGELPLRREQFMQLKRDLHAVHDVMGLTKTTRMLRSRWPHIFVTYLSFTAAYNTNFGFWDRVQDDLGLTHKTVVYAEKNHWGKMYLDLIDDFGLDNFSDLDSGHKYVTPIRLQGGIPRYSLPDFFEFVILPTVEKPSLAVLDDRTALEEIQEKSEVQYRVDQVVKLYLEHGGEYAVDFFSRTRKLARIAVQEDGVIPPADKLGLRPYVIQLFEDYLEGRVEPDSRRRVFSPRLVFWPHQAVFHLVLPEQTIPEGYAYRNHEWRLRLYENQEIQDEDQFQVRVFRRGDEIHTESKEIDIEYPYQQAVVEFGSYLRKNERHTDDGEFKVLRRWPLRLMPDSEHIPVKSFDQQGKVIRHAEGLPPDYVWLIIPGDYSIRLEGEARRIEDQGDYWGAWSVWKSELWDLTDVRHLELLDSEGESAGVLPVLQPLPVPYLEGENRPDYSQPVGEIPLYVGKPPSVIFPMDQEKLNESGFTEAEEWSMRLGSTGPASPDAEHRLRISEFKSDFVLEDSSVFLPLSAVLGERPAGTYQLEISRPDGKIMEETFRVWPDLKVTGWKPLFLPESGRYGSVDLELSLPEGSSLEVRGQLSARRDPVQIELESTEENFNKYCVSIPRTYSSGEFFLVEGSGEKPVRIPLKICLPRLQWTVKLDDTSVQEVVWHSTLQDIPLAKVAQAGQSVMYVASDLARESRVKLSLHLTLPESERVLQTLSGRLITDREPRCGFNLRKFLDTIRFHKSEPFFDLLLEVYAPESGERTRIPVLRITRALDVREVDLEEIPDSGLRLHWKERDPLQHRRVQIWPVWQPWRDPVEIRLPDDASVSSTHGAGWFMVDLLQDGGALDPGSYVFRFIALPPWEEKPLPEYPPVEDVLYFRTGDPAERLERIRKELQGQTKKTFVLHFEQACILADLGKSKERDKNIAWLSSHSEKASVPLLMKFYYWLEGWDPFTQKALRMRMYQPIWLKRLFSEYDSGEIIKRYLDPIKEMGNFSPESARLILEHTDFPDLISRAVRRLVDAEDEFVVGYLLGQLEKGRFTVLGAFEILKDRAEFALYPLLDCPDSDVRSQLLKELAEYTDNPLIVYCGWWIRTDAGWGRIEKIHFQEPMVVRDYYRIDNETPVLEVTLRPKHHALPVLVDLKDRKIEFQDVDCLFLCSHNSSCFHFASDNRNEIIEKHNRSTHGGLQPSFRTIRKSSIPLRKSPIYSTLAPKDPYQ